MKVAHLYNKGRPVYSLEVFPPKNGENLEAIYDTIDHLLEYEPAFVSVTGGAMGSMRGGTVAIAAGIKRRFGLEGIPHFTCVNKSKLDIENMLMEMKFDGISNVFALRGDPPMGKDKFEPHPEGHSHASGLVQQIQELNEGKYILSDVEKNYEAQPTDFGIAAAGYPNGHPECPDRKKDLQYLKFKIDNGADYVVTQLFFDADVFIEFVNNAHDIGIDVPIIPGVMPMDKYGQIKFVSKQMGIELPKKLAEKLEENKDDPETIKKILEEHSINMCIKLVEKGAPGIQFFTMDKPEGTKKILEILRGGDRMREDLRSFKATKSYKDLMRALEIEFGNHYRHKHAVEIRQMIENCMKDCADKYFNGNVLKLIRSELDDLKGYGYTNPEYPGSIYRCIADNMLKFHRTKELSSVA